MIRKAKAVPSTAFAAMAEIDVAGQAEHARIEGERRDADQQLRDEERRQEDEQRQRAPARGIAQQADDAARGEQRREDAAAEADDQAVVRAIGVERAVEEIVIGLQREGRRERPDDVLGEGRVDHVEDRRVEEDIEQDEQRRHEPAPRLPALSPTRSLRAEPGEAAAPQVDGQRASRRSPATRQTNSTTPMAEPSAQVPVSPNCWPRLMPKDVGVGPAEEARRDRARRGRG